MIDTLTTLLPICQTTDHQYVLVANPKVPANTAAELVALARREPGKLTYSSAGIGSGLCLHCQQPGEICEAGLR